MNDLQVVNEANGRSPDFRRHFRSPIVVPIKADAVAGQIERGAALPVRPEHGAETATVTPGPEVGAQNGVAFHVPRTRCWRGCWIISAIKAQ